MKLNLRSFEYRSFYSGLYDDYFIISLQKLMDPNGLTIDVGANIGFYTIPIANEIKIRKGCGKIIAFEPHHRNIQRLKENLKINQLGDFCICFDIALSNTNRNAELLSREYSNVGTGNASILEKWEHKDGRISTTVRRISLDMFAKEHSLDTLELIKADIEGHEDRFLEGSQQVLQKTNPFIFLEMNKFFYERRGINMENTFASLIPKNYEKFCIVQNKWLPLDKISRCNNIENILLVPNQKKGKFLRCLT